MMNFKLLSFSLFSVAAISPLFMPSLTPSALALGCVATDVGVQVNVSGSKAPGRQTNTTNQQFGKNCVGNSVTNVGTQQNVGGSQPADQNRNSTIILGDGPYGPPGVGDVGINVHIPVNVYNPADDPEFLRSLPGR
jgi:hypothetical protein